MLTSSLALALATSATLAQEPATPRAGVEPPPTTAKRLQESLFQQLDKNRDGVIADTEMTGPEATPYLEELRKVDRNHDGRITREEFSRAGELPLHRDPRTAAALLLILSFACFCMFLDGLLEPERRDYFWWSIAGTAGLSGLAYLCARGWFLEESPFLGFIAAAPAVLIVLAWLTGATQENEEPPAVPTGPVVYKVAGKPASSATPPQKAGGQAPRKPSPPVRSPRPAPLPRPQVPERRPQTPPRPPPPRPPGSTGGPKPPPGKQ